jgi:outer membrane protein assembly factor BamB/DNA-binding HxlR family transcriptional regulator
MEDDQEDQRRAEIFDALGHPTRINILKTLNEETMGFADLKKKVGIDSSGHLQHHLNKLDGLIKTDENGKYCLSDQGKDALQSIQIVERATESTSKKRFGHIHMKSSRLLKIISVFLAVALVVVSVVAIFEYTQLQPDIETEPEDNAAWTRELYVTFAAFTIMDDKTFTMTRDGDIYCFDQETGETLWSQSLGGYVMLSQIIVENGRVFVGSRESILNCLSEENGSILYRFRPFLASSIASKSAPDFSVSDGRVFVSADGFHVLNATNGELLWEYPYGSLPNSVGNGGWTVADNRVFARGWENIHKLFCFNITDGSILWEDGIKLNSPPIVNNGQVLVWNYDNNTILKCLDEFTGSTLWSIDFGKTIFRPTLYDSTLLFGLADGDFQSETESGSRNWIYSSMHETSSYSSAAAPQILNGMVITGYESGYLTALNLSDGKLVWRTPVSGDVGSITLSKNVLVVTSGTTLYLIDPASGGIQESITFQYWILTPQVTENRLFIAADGKVIAFDDITEGIE